MVFSCCGAPFLTALPPHTRTARGKKRITIGALCRVWHRHRDSDDALAVEDAITRHVRP
jgi:hypothetical protein